MLQINRIIIIIIGLKHKIIIELNVLLIIWHIHIQTNIDQ